MKLAFKVAIVPVVIMFLLHVLEIISPGHIPATLIGYGGPLLYGCTIFWGVLLARYIQLYRNEPLGLTAAELVDGYITNIPKDTRWTHTNGNRYTVRLLTNLYSNNLRRYPVMVVHEGDNGKVWSRPASDWFRSMTPEDPQAVAKAPIMT